MAVWFKDWYLRPKYDIFRTLIWIRTLCSESFCPRMSVNIYVVDVTWWWNCYNWRRRSVSMQVYINWLQTSRCACTQTLWVQYLILHLALAPCFVVSMMATKLLTRAKCNNIQRYFKYKIIICDTWISNFVHCPPMPGSSVLSFFSSPLCQLVPFLPPGRYQTWSTADVFGKWHKVRLNSFAALLWSSWLWQKLLLRVLKNVLHLCCLKLRYLLLIFVNKRCDTLQKVTNLPKKKIPNTNFGTVGMS